MVLSELFLHFNGLKATIKNTKRKFKYVEILNQFLMDNNKKKGITFMLKYTRFLKHNNNLHFLLNIRHTYSITKTLYIFNLIKNKMRDERNI